MKCPLCSDGTLQPKALSARNTDVLQCALCQSFWLEDGKINMLLGAQAALDMATALDMAVPSYAMLAHKSCPQCSRELYEFCYPNTQIILVGCKSCHGLSIEREYINAIDTLIKNSLQLTCPRCATNTGVNKQYIAYAACSSCGSLFKNWFDSEGRALPEAPIYEPVNKTVRGARRSKLPEAAAMTRLGKASWQGEDSDEEDYEYSYGDEWASVSDAALEYKFCLFAIPSMLLVGLLFNSFSMGASIQRIWLSMPVHELGHALTAWLTGYNAIPTLWFTHLLSDSRGFIAPVLLLSGILTVGRYALVHDSKFGLLLVFLLLVLQCIGTFVLSPATANMLFYYGGDGMGLIIATLLMCSFYYGKNTRLYSGALRWGFLVIGAATFVDIYMVWFRSLDDLGSVPYGTTGGQFTDSYHLIEAYGWTFDELIRRYVRLGNVCFIMLSVAYYRGLKKAKTIMVQRAKDEQLV